MRGAQEAADSLIHEAPAAGTLTEDVPPKSFVARTGPLGRTNGEWLGFLPACGSATLLAFGLTADCALIPGLNAFCIAFAAAVLVNACLELKLRTKYKKSQGIELRPGENLAQILALSQPGLAIWGAVLTWPRARLLTEPDPRCGSSEVFIGGFVASTIVISIIGCMLVGAILVSLAQWIHGCQRQTSGSTSSDAAVADPEATLVSGDRSDAVTPLQPEAI